MCDVSLAIGVAAAAAGGIGSIYSASADAAAANYNAQIQKMNAELSRRRANDALERGAAEEQKKRAEVAQLKGKQLAAIAANGIDPGFGSPLDAMVDTAALGELDALTIRRNAARESYDYQVQAVNGEAEASLLRMNAKNTMTAGYLNAAGTVLGGLGTSYGDYQQRQIGSIG